MINKNKVQKSIYLHLIEPSIGIDNFEFHNISKIKKIKKKSVQEIYIGDLLDYFSDEEVPLLLVEIISKLTTNGKLHIQSYDTRCLVSALVYNNINTSIFKNLIFNAGKKNIHTLGEIKRLLDDNNIKLNKCKYMNAIQYYIECIKE